MKNMIYFPLEWTCFVSSCWQQAGSSPDWGCGGTNIHFTLKFHLEWLGRMKLSETYIDLVRLLVSLT